MSSPMVRAILAGAKTQTRRLVRGVDPVRHIYKGNANGLFGFAFGVNGLKITLCPYGDPGDRLWVREAFTYERDPVSARFTDRYLYRATHEGDCVKTDGDGFTVVNKDGSEASPWIPSIHMPRAASRITLEVEAVRVERLHAITREDAMAEGVPQTHGEAFKAGLVDDSQETHVWDNRTTVENFALLWDSINAERGPWASNPWIWVVTFRRAT